MVFNMVERKKKKKEYMTDRSSGIRKTLNSNNAALAHTHAQIILWNIFLESIALLWIKTFILLRESKYTKQINPYDHLQHTFSPTQHLDSDQNNLNLHSNHCRQCWKLPAENNNNFFSPFHSSFYQWDTHESAICSIRIHYYVHTASHTMILLFATSK